MYTHALTRMPVYTYIYILMNICVLLATYVL